MKSMGRKDPSKYPVPSFIELKDSSIPNAGTGAFATKFIPGGYILGSYKGKIYNEDEYKKLEAAKKESGYAWKVSLD